MLYLICTTMSRVEHARYEVPYAQELGTCMLYNSRLCATGINDICAAGKNITLGFESKAIHLTLYQRKVTSEELPHWPLKQPKYAYIQYFK